MNNQTKIIWLPFEDGTKIMQDILNSGKINPGDIPFDILVRSDKERSIYELFQKVDENPPEWFMKKYPLNQNKNLEKNSERIIGEKVLEAKSLAIIYNENFLLFSRNIKSTFEYIIGNKWKLFEVYTLDRELPECLYGKSLEIVDKNNLFTVEMDVTSYFQ